MNGKADNDLVFPIRHSAKSNVLWVALVALIYFAVARLSMLLEFQPEGIAAVWPPSGIFLAAILLTRRDLRPWLAGTLFIADFIVGQLAGATILVGALYSLVLTGDAMFSCWLLLRLVGSPITFGRVRQVAGWLALSVLFSNGLASLAAAAASQLLPETGSFWSSFLWWGSSDGVGNLLMTPFILSWAAWSRTKVKVWDQRRALEASALLISLILVSYFCLSYLSDHKLFGLFFPYAIFPLMLWAALRFEVRGVATALIILAAVALPFAQADRIPSFSYAPGVLDDVIVMQLFLVLLTVPSLFLAATVAEQRRAVADRLAGAQRQAVTLKSIGDAVIATDTRGRVELVNPEAERLTGWRQEEARGKRLEEVFRIIREDTRQTVESAIEHVLRDGQVVELANHTLLIARDGSERPIANSGAPIHDEQNQIIGVVLVFRDQTQERAVARAINESETRLRLALDAAHMGTWDWNIRTGRVVWSAGHEALWGYAPGSFPGTFEAYESRLHPDDVAGAQRAGEKALATHQNYTHEFRVRRPDGTVRWIASLGQPYYGPDGEPVRMIGVAMDITERKQAEDGLRASEEQHRLLAEIIHAYSFSYRVNPDRSVEREWSTASQSITGYSTTELKAHGGFRSIVHPDDRENYWQSVLRAIDGRTETPEFRIVTKSGETRWLQSVNRPEWSAAEGRVVRIQGSAQEITERKRAEEKLQTSELQHRLLAEIINGFAFSYRVNADRSVEKEWSTDPKPITGYTNAELKARGGFRTIIHPDDRERHRQAVQRVIDGQTEKIEVRIITKSGETRWHESINRPEWSAAEGRVVRIQGAAQETTARKLAEEQIRLLAHAVETTNDLITITDLNDRFTFANKAFLEAYGYTAEEILGQTPALLMSPNNPPELLDTILAASRSKNWRGEMIDRRKDGSEFPISLNTSPIRDASGQVMGLLGVARDITERVRAEAKLRESEQRFKALAEVSPVGIFQTDAQGRTTYVNPQWCEISGLSAEESLGDGWLNAVHPDDRGKIARGWQAATRTQRASRTDYRFVRPDGTIAWVMGQAIPETDPTGRVVGYVGTITNITERKHAEAARDLLAMAVEQASENIVITDPNGAILYVNPAFERTTGYTVAEALGRNPRILKSGRQDPEFYRQMWETLKRGETWSGHIINRCKDGKLIEEEVVISPVRDAAGTTVNYVAVKRDVTREVLLETQVRHTQKMEAVGTLAAGVAHDFNNILAIIQMQAGLLGSSGGLSAEQSKFAAEIGFTVERAAALTRQLLLFSRREVPQPRDLNLGEAVTGVAKMLQRMLGETIALQLNLAAQPLFVHADAGTLDQVLLNLAVNARDAMPKGGQLVITTSAVVLDEIAASQFTQARPGAFACLSVSDNGCGIPPEILPRIFEPFFTTKEVGRGTGLGLATVYGIVQKYHGWINVYSEVGQGTTFRVYLPQLAKPADARPVPPALATPRGGTETILLVEDELVLRDAVRKALGQLGYHTLEASSGVKALEIWKEHHWQISLLLTDLIMPEGMSGKDLAERLLKENPRLKVVYMSGYSAEVAGKDFPLNEGVNFLAKPFEPHKLAQTIRDRLDS